MRNLLFITSLLIVCYSYAVANERGLESPWSYNVISSEADPTMDDQHATFELSFSAIGQTETNPFTAIELSCNGVIERFTLDSTFKKTLLVSPGTYTFQVVAGPYYDEITTQAIQINPGFRTKLAFQFVSNQEIIIFTKPVIYLYPEKELQTTVQIVPNGEFSFTYPAYPENGWSVTARPDGQLTIDGKNYPYLFWEGNNTKPLPPIDYSTGFVVEKENVTAFLEEKLTAMGLNDQERTDFITWWGPKMVQSEKGFVHFLFNEEYDQIGTINVVPKPASIFRIYLFYAPLEKNVELNPTAQEIKSVDRKGFTVIEWGGSEVKLELL